MTIRHYNELSLDEKRAFIQLLLEECSVAYIKSNCKLEYVYMAISDTLRNLEIIVLWEEINSATITLELNYRSWRSRIIDAITESNKELYYRLDNI